MRYEFTKPEEYRAIKATVPIAYLPWGAHEWHGLHNPLGLDTLKVHGICQALCAATGGIVFPQIYCGHQTMKPYAGFDATLEFSPECVTMLAREYLAQLGDEGFKVIVIMMGHYGGDHQKLLTDAVAEFNASRTDVVAWAFPDYDLTKPDGIEGDHAGPNETSYMMLFHPELVDLSRLTTEEELDTKVDGIMGGDPRIDASSARGLQALQFAIKAGVPQILELLRQMEERDG